MNAAAAGATCPQMTQRTSPGRGTDSRPGGKNWRHWSARRRVLDQRRDRLALVGGECCDVDEPGDVGIVARLRNHNIAVGVADQNRGPVLRGQRAPGDRDIVSQRHGGILDDGHVVAILLENVVDALPTRPVNEPSVNEKHVLDTFDCIRLRHAPTPDRAASIVFSIFCMTSLFAEEPGKRDLAF